MACLRISMALVVLLCTWQAARADRGWKFDVASKAAAMSQAQDHGLGFDDDGTEQPETLRAMFADWCQTYGLASPSDRAAFQNFKAAMKEVRRINMDASLPWWASGNPYSHLSPEDFSRAYMGAKPPTDARRSALEAGAPAHTVAAVAADTVSASHRKMLGRVKVPSSPRPSPTPSPSPSPKPCPSPCSTVNWVSRGMVTPVRNQGGCGSCWAFAGVAAMESMYLLSGQGNINTLDLSEQQLVSCTTGFGCSGGWLDQALNYFVTSPVDRDSLWPYTSSNGTCNTALIASLDSGNAVQANAAAKPIPGNNETALTEAVMQSPVPFLMSCDYSFQMYAGGVYSSSTCTTAVNHAMLIVGKEWDSATGQYYWLVKNSWGASWGLSGYIRVAAIGDGPGMCGMQQWAWRPATTFVAGAPLL